MVKITFEVPETSLVILREKAKAEGKFLEELFKKKDYVQASEKLCHSDSLGNSS
ncbi:MAG: hypothetical protein LZ163_05080 [Thaumarchaeota archaeon]|jgi:hypothetical protein|nr:hypothetical protein [Candidatus Terraquivivens yellowstonensis]